ncbi:MAG: histidine phosphatase family protein [Thermoplasmata archaeon]|nr:histidine phosphatase family protein [Thermoplasmata archaeon]
MELYVFRHGPAEEADPSRWPDDMGRPLSEEGVRESRRAAKGLAGLVGEVPQIASSPMVRARATAELLAEQWNAEPKVAIWPELASGELAAPILERIDRSARENGPLVLVGHEPTLTEFVGLAVTGEAVPICRLARAGAAALEFPRTVQPGAARIAWVLTRRQLMEQGR